MNQIREPLEIRPSDLTGTMAGLLTARRARILPMKQGETEEIDAGDGDFWLAASEQGVVTLTSRTHHAVLNPGQAMALWQSGSFSLQCVTGGVCMLVELRGELPARILEERLEEGAALFPDGMPAVREAVMGLSVLAEEGNEVSGSVASAKAYTMLATLLESRKADPQGETASALSPLVESAVSIIREEFPYLEGLDELAERLEVSKAHLIRTFTAKVGISPGRYITRVRIEYAKALLRDPDSSITYVAEASGFANANYFAKVFRRETGLSPTEYLEINPPVHPAKPGRDRGQYLL